MRKKLRRRKVPRQKECFNEKNVYRLISKEKAVFIKAGDSKRKRQEVAKRGRLHFSQKKSSKQKEQLHKTWTPSRTCTVIIECVGSRLAWAPE